MKKPVTIINCDIQNLKDLLLEGLRYKPLPYGAPPNTRASRLINLYRERNDDMSREEHLMRRCHPEFLRAYRAIVRYSPQLSGPNSRAAFRAFLEHRQKFPRFYDTFREYVMEAVEKGIHRLSGTTIIHRTLWDFAVDQRDGRLRTLNSNIMPHYLDYWTLDNPDVPFSFRHRNAKGFRRRRNFIMNGDLDLR